MNKLFVPILLVFLLFFSCKKRENTQTDIVNKPLDTTEAEIILKNIYYSLPSPMEIATEMEQRSAFLDVKQLNPSSNSAKYLTKKAKSLNLGIYTADLGFLIAMNHSQNVEEYFQNVMKLSESLGVSRQMNDSLFDLIEDNLTNPDSLIRLSSKAFFTADAYLKEHNKIDISVLSLNGGWIESLYLLCQMLDANPADTVIRNLLLDQHSVAVNIYKLDSLYLTDYQGITATVKDLQIYFDNCIEIKKVEKYDEFEDTTRIKTITIYKCDEENLKDLEEKIKEIRKNFITLQ